jgi:hypothetical protein
MKGLNLSPRVGYGLLFLAGLSLVGSLALGKGSRRATSPSPTEEDLSLEIAVVVNQQPLTLAFTLRNEGETEFGTTPR